MNVQIKEVIKVISKVYHFPKEALDIYFAVNRAANAFSFWHSRI